HLFSGSRALPLFIAQPGNLAFLLLVLLDDSLVRGQSEIGVAGLRRTLLRRPGKLSTQAAHYPDEEQYGGNGNDQSAGHAHKDRVGEQLYHGRIHRCIYHRMSRSPQKNASTPVTPRKAPKGIS